MFLDISFSVRSLPLYVIPFRFRVIPDIREFLGSSRFLVKQRQISFKCGGHFRIMLFIDHLNFRVQFFSIKRSSRLIDPRALLSFFMRLFQSRHFYVIIEFQIMLQLIHLIQFRLEKQFCHDIER